MSGPFLKDSQWVRQAFLVKAGDLETVDLQNRTFTSASLKYTDSSPGGNICINPPPQRTRYADIRYPGRFSENNNDPSGRLGRGQGRWVSEVLDDSAQIVHFRMGIPAFNNMVSFFTGFYDSDAGSIARTGRGTDLFYKLGKAAGFVVSIAAWPLMAVHLVGLSARALFGKPSSRYYSSKPMMSSYWSAVTTIVNHIAINRGIIPRILDKTANERLGTKYEAQDDVKQVMHKLIPTIFSADGGIDVYAYANRAQRLANRHRRMMQTVLDEAADGANIRDLVQKLEQTKLTDTPGRFQSYLAKWLGTDFSQPRPGIADTGAEPMMKYSSATTAPDSGRSAQGMGEPTGFLDKVSEFFAAELNDGAAFVSFRVNATQSVQEGFSNSVTESELKTKINGLSSAARSANFSFAGGNITGGLIDSAIGAVKSATAGFLDGVNLQGIVALAGSAFADIPKHWQDSAASLPRASYTITLTSPYANPMSQMINIYIPLAMLLAMALPQSTGRQSYGSPFLVEYYDQGRCQSRLSMVDSLQITRGGGNQSFNHDNVPLSMEVTLSLVDLSSVMHMPIAEGFRMTPVLSTAAQGAIAGSLLGPAGTIVGAGVGAAAGYFADGAFDDETVFSDYMAVLGGLGLADQIYAWRRLKMNMLRQNQNFSTWLSTSHFASWAGDTIPGRFMSALFKGTAR